MSAAGRVHNQPFNPRLDYNHADDKEYQRLRDLAEQEYKKHHELSQKSQDAYNSGDGGEAKELSNQSKKHRAKMDDYNHQAAEFVFRANNADSDEDEIDLHGLYVKEAEEFLEKRIQACLQRNETHLDVIVGKGLHSENGVAKLKPAVERLCRKHHFKYALDEDNAGVVVIDFTGSGGHVSMPNINRPQKSHKKYQNQQQPQYHAQQPHYQNNYNQQQQQQSSSQGQSGLIGLVCGLLKACLK